MPGTKVMMQLALKTTVGDRSACTALLCWSNVDVWARHASLLQ